MAQANPLRVGVDIGGTFTDIAILDETGIRGIGKTLTTHAEPAAGVEELLRRTLREHRIDPAGIGTVVHGTTLVTNALIERRGAYTALLTTEGFRDVVEMGREHRYELYDLALRLPRPLVPRHLRFGVAERMRADGTPETPLDTPTVKQLAGELSAAGITAVGVCFLHSHINDRHEQQAREAIASCAPELRVALSCEVNPEIREYERCSTTLANVYVQELAERYLDDLRGRLRGLGLWHDPLIMLSNGGLAAIDVARAHPIRMLESGPAGGTLGAVSFGRASGHADQMAFDMGGTTAKLCTIADHRPLVTHSFEVDRAYRLRAGSGLPVRAPVIDMIEIGTGGGSIARVNSLGLITVGPDSAGSEPGPVCYGRGGTECTVTDADLVLGYLDPERFLGGELRLDTKVAAEAIREQIAEPLGIELIDAAWGIHATANEGMANAARVHAIERGQDPSSLPLFVSGGNGSVHGPGVARVLGSPSVLVPPAAGVLSALGFLSAPMSIDRVRSRHAKLSEVDREVAKQIFAAMETESVAVLTGSAVHPGEIEHERTVEMRFIGQGSEIEVSVPHLDEHWDGVLEQRFREQYAQRFGDVAPCGVGIEILTWRVTSRGPEPRARLRFQDTCRGEPSLLGQRAAYFAGMGVVETEEHDRYRLASGTSLEGPALICERESTLVLDPDMRCSVGEDGSIAVERVQASTSRGGSHG